MKKFIILGMFFTMLVLVVSPVMAEGGSWGIGQGIPYGITGVNIDVNIISYLDLSLGLGINSETGLCPDIGLKLYLASEEKNFRPRISCYYGTNTIVEEHRSYWGVPLGSDYTSYNGVTAGVGASVFFGKARQHGFDFDIMYIVSTKFDADELREKGYTVEEDNGVKFSLGYRQAF